MEDPFKGSGGGVPPIFVSSTWLLFTSPPTHPLNKVQTLHYLCVPVILVHRLACDTNSFNFLCLNIKGQTAPSIKHNTISGRRGSFPERRKEVILKLWIGLVTYLIIVIFLTLTQFLENKIYTEKRQFFALNL